MNKWKRSKDGGKKPVEVVWKSGNKLGVRFLETETDSTGAMSSASVKANIIGQIDQIEKQLAKLKNEVMVHIRE